MNGEAEYMMGRPDFRKQQCRLGRRPGNRTPGGFFVCENLAGQQVYRPPIDLICIVLVFVYYGTYFLYRWLYFPHCELYFCLEEHPCLAGKMLPARQSKTLV